MTRVIVGLLGFWMLVAAVPALAAPLSTDQALAERSLGNPDAPVTMYEYSSLSCGHCADFHSQTLPQIKKAYIETGLVRLIMRDFPFGDAAVDAHMLARCVAPSRYFGMMEAFFSTQAQWRASANPRADLIRLALLAGLSPADAKTCLANDALRAGVLGMKDYGHKTYGIKGTPSFLIEGTKIPGALPFEDFADIIDGKLAAKGIKR